MHSDEEGRVYDELLVTLVRAGNKRAADRLAARWYPRLLRTARRLLGDQGEAQDAVQDAWTGICRGWMGLSDPAKFPVWAFSILHRKCADRLRHTIRDRTHLCDVENVAVATPAQADDRSALEQAFGRLSADHREVAVLFFAEGLTLHEISVVTAVPVGTVKSRLFTARHQLRALLKGDDDVQ
ncbi:sigma-70 family RNA polymerase sigma factor [Parvularcula sp. LCG005]|uniref:RNA polymerase sigma factor n=1 Tax=Parvularcula sp. LCG005 TaxID=3078805 RepID=UPI002943E032|nr:sigma-70 family RNA polymerase sigma factor [Parvularcula sp. LCG005]WOI53367.1 sigma-70 family RNA polymerase sigma factor [Parvularcula sp. LCG005]